MHSKAETPSPIFWLIYRWLFCEPLVYGRLVCGWLFCARLVYGRLVCGWLLCERLLCERLLYKRLVYGRLVCGWLFCAAVLCAGGCGERPGLISVEPDGRTDGGFSDGQGLDSGMDGWVPVDAAPLSCDDPPLLEVTHEEQLCVTSPRAGGDAFYDPQRDRVLIFGGLRGSGDYTPDVISIDLASRTSRLLSWVGSAPQGWTHAGAVYDSTGQRAFIIAGTVYGSFSARVLELRLVGADAVESIPLENLPVQARGPAAGYNPQTHQLVVFGGYDGTGDAQHHRATWVLNPDDPSGSWQKLFNAGGPPAQENARMVYVPTYGFVLLASTDWTGGEMTLYTMREESEQWTEIGLLPTWNTGNRFSFFWDAGACRLIYWGGGCTSGAYSIELFDNTGATQPIDVPFADVESRVFMNATLDSLRSRIVVHGGYDCSMSEFLQTVDEFSFDR